MTRTHLLIGCAGRKLDRPAPARDLYTGPLFRAARGHAEASGLPWHIVSGLHGILDPGQVVEPYDVQIPRAAQPWAALASRVAGQLQELDGSPDAIEVHGGAAYVELIAVAVVVRGLHLAVLDPLSRLQVGERLRWYREQRVRRAA